jgi:integrase
MNRIIVQSRSSIWEDKHFRKFLETRHRNYSPATSRYYCSLIDRFIRFYHELDYEHLINYLYGAEMKSLKFSNAELSGGRPYLNTAPRKFALLVYLEYLGREDLVAKIKAVKTSTLVSKRKVLFNERTFDTTTEAGITNFESFISSLREREQIMYKIMWVTASRISGMVKLRVRDVFINERLNSFMVKLYKKGGDEYNRPITNVLYLQFHRYAKTHNLQPDVFIFRDRKETERHAYLRIWSELKTKSRQSHLVSSKYGISAHYVRHSRADNVYTYSKKDILQVKRLLAHKSLTTTEIYLKRSEKEDEEILSKMIKAETEVVK